MPRPTYPPDYCDREQLAYRLSCASGYVDQLQRMGRIPPPVEIGPGMVRWRWADVERVIEGVANADQPGSHGADPYWIPIHRELRPMLAEIQHDAVTVLANASGRPWTKTAFNTAWRAAWSSTACESQPW